MSDMMMFPKTVDEFMEQYKIVDSDKVYTNGAELVPIFRMKQWFEHRDAEPVKHGHWVKLYQGNYKCSECGDWWSSDYNDEVINDFNYCPSCGARMESEEVLE